MSEFSFAVSASIAASANNAGSNGRTSAITFSPAVEGATKSHGEPPASGCFKFAIAEGRSMPRLAGRAAFITGAGNGIGRATAILFAREGARVAIAEIYAQAGEEPAHLARNETIAIHADVTDPDSLQSAIRATVDKFGRLDVLHNNAGGSTAQDDTAVNAPLDEFWRAIKLDLYGTLLGCGFGIPELIKAGGGSVINMSSNVALMGVAGRDCYHRSKGWNRRNHPFACCRLAPQRVRVNAIAPSATMTERVKKLVAGNAALTRLADSHLLGLIEPNDIASTALYLASDESRMVTGQVVPVDSGVTIS
jgi:NAD(P)-dependent dehydrogenase (short-subunit alcohol dehydrogenase family)